MTSQKWDFNLHFKTGPASAVITSIYLVGQRWRLPTPRQPGDRWAASHGAAHASVFILPKQTPKPQTGFAPLLRQHPPPRFACDQQLAALQEPNSTTTSPSKQHFQVFSEKKTLLLRICLNCSPTTAAHSRASFSPASTACVSTGCRRQLAVPAAAPKSHGNAFPTAKPHSSRDTFLSFQYRVAYLNMPTSYTCLFHMKTNKKPQYFACWVVKT